MMNLQAAKDSEFIEELSDCRKEKKSLTDFEKQQAQEKKYKDIKKFLL